MLDGALDGAILYAYLTVPSYMGTAYNPRVSLSGMAPAYLGWHRLTGMAPAYGTGLADLYIYHFFRHQKIAIIITDNAANADINQNDRRPSC